MGGGFKKRAGWGLKNVRREKARRGRFKRNKIFDNYIYVINLFVLYYKELTKNIINTWEVPLTDFAYLFGKSDLANPFH